MDSVRRGRGRGCGCGQTGCDIATVGQCQCPMERVHEFVGMLTGGEKGEERLWVRK
jgi:hypothetical protein